MIARGLGTVLLGILGLGAAAAAAALLIGAAAGLPALRAVSGGFLLVGSFVFVAGAASGIRMPSRQAPKRSSGDVDGRRSPSDAVTVSGLLVGTGILFVVVGVLLDPETSF